VEEEREISLKEGEERREDEVDGNGRVEGRAGRCLEGGERSQK